MTLEQIEELEARVDYMRSEFEAVKADLEAMETRLRKARPTAPPALVYLPYGLPCDEDPFPDLPVQ